jgi:hypothetical protein
VNVAVVSTSPDLPYRLFADYLQRRPDFQASKFVLVEDPEKADAIIRLSRADGRGTGIVVSNAATKERAGTRSEWTNYPGMVALDAMQDLASVCPGSVREVVTRVAASCPSSNLVYAPVTSLSACSRTSWIGNPELYAALQTNGKLKALGVELRAVCSPADAQLEVRHNLDLTVEWTWQLKSKQGEVLLSGRVIAFQGKDVRAKITGQAIKQIATTAPDSTRIADGGASSPTLAIAPRAIRVVWLPYDSNVVRGCRTGASTGQS